MILEDATTDDQTFQKSRDMHMSMGYDQPRLPAILEALRIERLSGIVKSLSLGWALGNNLKRQASPLTISWCQHGDLQRTDVAIGAYVTIDAFVVLESA